MHTLRRLVPFCLGVLTVPAATIFHVNPPKLPDAIAGKAYSGGPLLLQGGGECPRNVPVVHVVAGALPGGMFLTSGGQFGGTPLEPGRYEFVVRVENGCGWSDQTMSLDVAGAPFLLANPAAIEFRVGQGEPIAPVTIQVSGNAVGAAYTVDTSAPWLRARPRAGRTPGAGAAVSSDLVDVEVAAESLPAGQHRGTIVIGGWRMAQPLIVPVRVGVLGPAPLTTQGLAPGEADPMVPRIALAPPAATAFASPATAPVAPAPHTMYAAPATPAKSAKPARKVSTPGRLSRSAQLRSKYLASKAAAPTAVHLPATPAADPQAKPSPSGEPVKKAVAAAHGKPADAHAKPADAHAKPADAHAKPADAHAKPADAHAKPAPAEPADAHRKPANAHAKAADPHAKPAENPKAAAKH